METTATETLGQAIKRFLRESGEWLSLEGLLQRMDPATLERLIPAEKALRTADRLRKAGAAIPQDKAIATAAGRVRLVQEAGNHLTHRGQAEARGKGNQREFRYVESVPMPKPIEKELLIDLIRLDGTQQRVELRRDVIEEYAEHVDDLPPVTVFFDGKCYYLADGFHRLNAHLFAGRVKILCQVREGTHRDAILYSVGSNAVHGLRRTPMDVKRAIESLLADPEWQASSVEWLANTVHCSWDKADKVRKEWLAAKNFQDGPRTGKDGRQYNANPTPPPKPKGKPESSTRDDDEEDEEPQGKPSPASSSRKAVCVEDKMGRPVPDSLRDVFADTRVNGLVKLLVDLETAISEGLSTGLQTPLAYLGVGGLKRLHTEIETIHTKLVSATPYAVCVECDGDAKSCDACEGKGFMTLYKHKQHEAMTRRSQAKKTKAEFEAE